MNDKLSKSLQALQNMRDDVIDFRDVAEGKSYSSDEDYELIEQELVTLDFIRTVWLSDKISEKKTVEYITEMLFSDRKWVKEEI